MTKSELKALSEAPKNSQPNGQGASTPKQVRRAAPTNVSSEKPLRVAELFAGVGGFRVGLEEANKQLGKERFQVVWSSQWEPSTKRQHASEVYEAHWGKEGHSNEDIAQVPAEAIPAIDVLVGGFPCQDYSVARTLNQAAGLAGKKGVLWWQIHRLLEEKQPRFGIFENVDRLLKSPATQRGRDFAVMLASLADLGYSAEWRMINAAEYGMPQKRRRVFIVVYRDDTPQAKRLRKDPAGWISKDGVIASAFPVCPLPLPGMLPGQPATFPLEGSLSDLTEAFNLRRRDVSPFANTGVLCGRDVLTTKTVADHTGPRRTLGDLLLPEEQVPPQFFIAKTDLPDWRFAKGAKSLERTKRNGVTYTYDEGALPFPDPTDRPARTIITGEGGPTPSRFKHVVLTPGGRHRRLTPVELERINTFPDDHTAIPRVTDGKRAFFMGNALVTEIITRLGRSLARSVAGT
jgi:DNA (cytosine-5)-methyltransferase 1